jgi:cytochrome c oxidase subunit 2
MACVALPFLLAARSSGQIDPGHLDFGRLWLGSGAQRWLVVCMLLFGVVLTYASLAAWPHRVSATSNAQTVNVTGSQWYWEIDKAQLVAGEPVVFNVHTQDVNHGMGIYDDAFQLLVQVQAMPGYLNRIQYTFEKPGKYRILCMEFCGVSHHDMTAEFIVSAEKT